ncbi:MAG TPA: sigma-70 family RNA polymerase sigma factor [Bacteroidales bacterium]|nr:sigma-70 family RNA polymerase sigma factor [Bacteroidales bacterium]
MEQFSNEDIIGGILNNNSKVLRYIYAENFPKVRQHICINGGSEDEAADVFQEAILIIFEKARKEQLVLTVKFSTYLYAVAKVVWKSYLRENRKEEDMFQLNETEWDFEIGEVDDYIIDNERFKLVWRYFDNISKDCQTIIRLFLEGKSISEVTQEMNYSSEQHTKNRRLRCKESLIKKIMADPKYKELCREIKIDKINRW